MSTEKADPPNLPEVVAALAALQAEGVTSADIKFIARCPASVLEVIRKMRASDPVAAPQVVSAYPCTIWSPPSGLKPGSREVMNFLLEMFYTQ